MKRATDPTTDRTHPAPTIDHLLNAMPATGLDSFEDRLETYATLGFYFDGTDYSNKSARVVSKLIKVMDAAIPSPLPAEPLEDEDNDRWGIRYCDTEYWITSPTIRNLPRQVKGNMPKYYRELIEKLATDPVAMLALPYYLFPLVGDALGKSLGIA